jgi:peptidoglycan/xylan/chitin deacetylase (PgdA/CDA1 family)
MNRVIGLKVDVDTYEGMQHGVPRLAVLFKTHGVRGSFFVPMGKDHTGRTVKRVFTRRGFLSKAGRVGVVKTYGIKTLLYGLVLPGPEIALGNAEILRQLAHDGHEVGIHGLDHVHWHDRARHLDRTGTEEILSRAAETYAKILGEQPLSFAAPGWAINGHAFAFFEKHHFMYSSDTRGQSPFYPRIDGRSFTVLQLPTTLPTVDEMVGLEAEDEQSMARYFLSQLTDGLNVLTVHAELEGKRWSGFLDGFIRGALEADYRFERLIDIASALRGSGNVPTCDITYGLVRGRAGEVALQKG